MARHHAEDVLYRAVIPTHIPDQPEVRGPYPKRHTAEGQVSRMGRGGHVEMGRVFWGPVT